jgi:hypothetical protein
MTMGSAGPPAEDDPDAYVFLDHRELESSIVAGVAEHLAPEHAVTAREDGEELFVAYRGREHRIPLTMSPSDRYVTVSSLAELLKDHYRFFALLPSHDTDTHGLLVVPTAQAQAWGPLPGHLAPLRLGFDYFRQLQIPYLDHEDSAPDFARESETERATTDALSRLLVSAVIGGKVDAQASAALARAVASDPKLRQQLDASGNASASGLAAELQGALEETLRDPEMRELRGRMDKSMAELQALVRGGPPPRKPWWKFW